MAPQSPSSSRSALALALARLFGMVCALAALSFLIRAIGIAGYGEFSVTLATGTLLIAGLELGVGTLVVRDVPLEDQSSPSLLESAWRVRHLSTVVYAIVGLILALIFYAHADHRMAEIAILLTVAVPYTLYGNLVQNGAYAYGRGAREAAVEVVAKLAWVVAVLLIYLIGGSWLIAAAVSFFIGGVPFLVRRWLTGRSLSRRVAIPAKQFLARSAPLALFPLIYLAFDRTDILGLALTSPSATVGRYSACYQFADAIVVLAAAALTILQPTYSEPKERKLRHDRSRRRLLIAASWLSVLGIAGSPIWLRIIAGNQLGSPRVALTTVTLLGIGTVAYVAVQCDMMALVAAHRSAAMFAVLTLGASTEFATVAWLGRYSIALAAGLVCALEFMAVAISSHLCARAGLTSALLRGSAPALSASLAIAAFEFALGPSIPISFVAIALCATLAALTPSARTEAFSALEHIPRIGPPLAAAGKNLARSLHLPTRS